MISPDYGHMVETVFSTTVPILLAIWMSREKTKKEVAKKHEENVKIWNQILNERENFPAHEHWERQGPLTADGIRRSPGFKA